MLRVTRSNKTTGCQNPQWQSPLELSFQPSFIKSQKKLSCDRNHKKGLIILFLSFNISILSKFPINVRSLLKSEYLLSQPSLMGETSLLKSSIREEGKCFQSWKVCTFLKGKWVIRYIFLIFSNTTKYIGALLWSCHSFTSFSHWLTEIPRFHLCLPNFC